MIKYTPLFLLSIIQKKTSASYRKQSHQDKVNLSSRNMSAKSSMRFSHIKRSTCMSVMSHCIILGGTMLLMVVVMMMMV